jgi:hypothetical protein
MVATAIAAGVGAVGSVVAGRSSSSAARNAAQTQAQASDRAAQVQREQFTDTMNMLRPRIQAGDTAIGQMMFELGLSPQPGIPGVSFPASSGGFNFGGQAGGGVGTGAEPGARAYSPAFSGAQGLYGMAGGAPNDGNDAAMGAYQLRGPMNTIEGGGGNAAGLPPGVRASLAQNAAKGNVQVQDTQGVTDPNAADPADPYGRFRNTPGYQFQLTEGLRSIDNSAASRGGLLRGSTLARLQEYGQGLADQTYGNYFNRLASLAGMGQTATGTAASLGSNTANNISGLISGAGDARASSYLTQGAIGANTIGSIGGGIANWIGGGGLNGIFGGGKNGGKK